MIVIADTTPLNYLVLLQKADLIQRLFGGRSSLPQSSKSCRILRPLALCGNGLQVHLRGFRYVRFVQNRIRGSTT